jgi:predicted acylesterase/phospholipase RssA
MADLNVRDNIAIAVDGGGIKGAIVARALMQLEEILGVKALIESPNLKVIAGTSTGSIVAGCLAAGMPAKDLLRLYHTLGPKVFGQGGRLRPFGKTVPLLSQLPGAVTIKLIHLLDWLPKGVNEFLIYPLFPARYSARPLREAMMEVVKQYPIGNTTNPTLADATRHLSEKYHGQTLIITAVEVEARRTHFFKTNALEKYQNSMTLIEAILASSAIPTYWEPVPLPKEPRDPAYDPPDRWLVDGGVGSFGNPALVAAWEMCNPANPDDRRRYAPSQTTILSFGTGTVSRNIYRKKYGNPRNWWALQWAGHVPDLFGDSAIREQSRNIVTSYEGIDLRRYQVEFDRVIQADAIHLLDTVLREKGEEMAKNLLEDRHALQREMGLRYDPERIFDDLLMGYFQRQ